MEALHQPGDIIAQRYRITDTLGQGGVGITYAAEELKSGEQVALKVLSLRQMGDWKVLELFEREAKILAQLNHPAIPRYLDYFQVDTAEDRVFYIVQQLAEGKSLADLVEIGWRTNESGVRRIATQILEILVYLHSLKPPVVHRDIKPQNLIWGQNAKIFLVDFGAVQDTYRSTFAKGSTIIGTYGYMAPEQFLGQAVPATDLYGLGATVLFLMTHRSPSDLPQERLKISFRSRIQISEGFADWLGKMLEPDVEDRFSSAKDALEALRGQRVVAKSKLLPSVSWKPLVGVGVAAIAAMTVLNSFKWAVLGTLGFQPSGICLAIFRGDIAPLKNYLNQGGNPFAYDADMAVDTKDDSPTLVDCALRSGTKDILELMLAKIADFNAIDNRSKTLLHLATVLRRKDIAERLITSRTDIKAKDSWGKTPLHYVRAKEMAELLIAKGSDVNARDKEGETPLYSLDSKEVAQLLIAQGADVNARNKNGQTPLYSLRSKEVAELLIAKGADVNARTQYGQTPLDSVIYRGNKDIVELLIAKGADVNARTQYGQTPLDSAIDRGNKDIVELLIAKGADVNARAQSGQTPLDSAIIDRGNKDIVELLIAKGADVNARTQSGQTPLHYVRSKEIAELLISQGADVNARTQYGHTPLDSAIDRGNKDIVELLIAKGADVNARNKEGETPLHYVRSKEVAELLISQGADVNARTQYGHTPLDSAVNRDNKGIVELLIAQGADVNARTQSGKTPLHYVRSKEVAELLIAKGADVNARAQSGKTPLHLVILYMGNIIQQNPQFVGDNSDEIYLPFRKLFVRSKEVKMAKEVAELLIAKGADVNARDSQGRTPLYSVRLKEMAELLIAKGADVNTRDNDGSTPLHSVASKQMVVQRSNQGEVKARNNDSSTSLPFTRLDSTNKDRIVELLIAKGADVNARDNGGFTPLHWAMTSKQLNIVKLLKSHGAIDLSRN